MHPAVIFDLDGVLADNSERLDAWIRAGGTEEGLVWADWYKTLPDDPPRPEYVALAKLLAKHNHILVLTARPESEREHTEDWLHHHLGFYWHSLHMWDGTCAYEEAKHHELEKILDIFHVTLAIDNEGHWCKLFRDFGIPTIHAADGFVTIASVDRT